MSGVPDFMRAGPCAATPGEILRDRIREFSTEFQRVAAAALVDRADALPESPSSPEPAAVDAPPPAFVPGVFEGMPFATYRGIDAMSQSGAKKILRSPLHFKVDREKPNEPTDAMMFGTAVHDGVLEPEAFDSRVVIAPEVNRRTIAGRTEWACFTADNAGKIILSVDDYQRARRCIDAVLAHPAASRLLAGSRREISLFWIDGRYGVPVKARLDVLNFGGIADVKTTKDASPEEFAKSIANYGYDIQGANYFSGAEHALNETPGFFVFIAVESEPPHAVACYQLGSASMMAGARRMDEALARYARALELGRWSGYPDTIETIDTPAWARRFNT